MKTLILGARGMLGTALCEVFKQEMEGWDKEELDITDKHEVEKKIGQLRPALIINAAAYTDVDGAEKNYEQALATNGHAVQNIVEAARRCGAILVHYSTDYVFSGEDKHGYSEDNIPGPPVNKYGESKLVGEHAVRESGLTYFLIRTAWLYGPNGKNFVDTILRLADEQSELKVVNDQYGSPTYTYDLAQVTQQLINKPYPFGVYHLVNQGVTNWAEFAQEAINLAGLPVKITPVSSTEFPRAAVRPTYSVLRNTRGPTLRPWQNALKDYIKLRSLKVNL